MKHLLLSFVLFVSFTANAKTLVVVDVDDTLRVTNRLYGSYTEQLDNVLDMEMPFSGMKELMLAFNGQDASIYYLTAAIDPFNELGLAFLEHNLFPQRSHFIYKPWWADTEDYKVSEVLNLIQKENPDTIILIGDNGEKDPAAYGRIQSMFPHTQVFIHHLYKGGYSAEIPSQQVGYVTTAEVAAYLEERGVFTTYQSHYVMRAVQSDLHSNSMLKHYLVLPYWSDITDGDMTAIYSRPFAITNDSLQMLLSIGESLF